MPRFWPLGLLACLASGLCAFWHASLLAFVPFGMSRFWPLCFLVFWTDFYWPSGSFGVLLTFWLLLAL
jgi:hypothetical protein